MNAIVSSTTVTSLVIHAFLGCCWHHAHVLPASAPSGTKSVQAICCHHDDCGDRPTQNHTPAPAKSPKQCEGPCVYLPTHKASSDGPAVLIPFDLPAFVVALVDSDGIKGLAWDAVFQPANTVLPLRLHLLHQILLV